MSKNGAGMDEQQDSCAAGASGGDHAVLLLPAAAADHPLQADLIQPGPLLRGHSPGSRPAKDLLQGRVCT